MALAETQHCNTHEELEERNDDRERREEGFGRGWRTLQQVSSVSEALERLVERRMESERLENQWLPRSLGHEVALPPCHTAKQLSFAAVAMATDKRRVVGGRGPIRRVRGNETAR